MWDLKNKINEQTKLKRTHRYREQTDSCQRGETVGELGDRGKGIKYKLVVTKESQGCKVQHREYSQYYVITVYGGRWGLEIPGGPHCKVYDCLTTMLYS